MKILFHENQLSYRGTSVAIYDYAHFNEELLGNTSVIVYNSKNPFTDPKALQKFKNRFKVLSYTTIPELHKIIEDEKPDFFYAMKSGEKDEVITNLCRTGVHVFFIHNEQHGDVYSYISEWLARFSAGEEATFVPYMVHLPSNNENLRKELNIPENARVFGCYGGGDSFNIKFVQQTIKKVASKNPDYYFIFMGMDDFTKRKYFWQKNRTYKNIIFLPPCADVMYKVKFINTCDAMIHARDRGETFGLAIGEFAIKGKPIITYKNSPEKAHIDIMKEKGYYYTNSKDLEQIFYSELNISPKENYEAFSPEKVMQKFKSVFLDN